MAAMQRVLPLTIAAGLLVVAAWVLIGGFRGRRRSRDFGTVSDAWLHDARNFGQDIE
jgi:hypothetical protein